MLNAYLSSPGPADLTRGGGSLGFTLPGVLSFTLILPFFSAEKNDL